MSISVIVPIKPNSRRLPNKNFLQLGNRPLSYHIFKTLIGISEISNVYCFTSYPYVLDLLPKGVKLLIRPEYLNSDDIGGNELFRYAIESIDMENMWPYIHYIFIPLKRSTHATNSVKRFKYLYFPAFY